MATGSFYVSNISGTDYPIPDLGNTTIAASQVDLNLSDSFIIDKIINSVGLWVGIDTGILTALWGAVPITNIEQLDLVSRNIFKRVPVLLNSNQNNYAPLGYVAVSNIWLNITSGSNTYEISGFASKEPGTKLVVKNVSNKKLNLLDNSVLSNPENRLEIGKNMTLNNGDIACFTYDTVISKWQILYVINL